MKLKWDHSFLISLVYGLFTVLYTAYIIKHPGVTRNGHFDLLIFTRWAYFLEFMVVGNYVYFILQGLVLRSKNWGLLLLLPLGLFAATIIAGYFLVGLIRLGGGDLLDKDGADMILVTLLLLVGTYFSLRLVRPRGRRINREGKKR